MLKVIPGLLLNIQLLLVPFIMVFFWLSPIIVMFLSIIISVFFVPLYCPFAIFIVPLVFTVCVAFLMDCLANNQLEPSFVSCPPVPFTYMVSPGAADTLVIP